MGRIKMIALYLGYLGALALGSYELVAKSAGLPGGPLPGWEAARHAERNTRWTRPTGWEPLDRLLHEAREAGAFYGLRGYPSSAAFSSRNASSDRYAS
jgi:hypothetical protein